MATKKKLSQEELILAFNEYMPKRPVYPPLINAAEPWENSDTDDDESDQIDPDISNMKYVIFDLNIEQSAECSEAYSDGKIKRPKLYLRDNVMAELEEALGKLMNLRLKPSDPVEWLAFQLMNISEMKKNQKKCQFKIDDHLRKPTGSQLDFKVLGTCTVVNIGMEKLHSFSPLPQCSTSAESTSAPDTLCGKRKLD